MSKKIRKGGQERRTGRASFVRLEGSLNWISHWPRVILLLLTLLCLLPFSGKAIHIDDPLFIWTAKHITRQPFNPYGFAVVWYRNRMPMWEVTQNPPLASYYAALIGSVAGWSERALHLGFIFPALGVVLGTYHLARQLTRKPLLAAAATLLAPGFLVSATGLMCDVTMLGIWILAMIFWIEGLQDPVKSHYLVLSGLLIAACALAKYFGVALIPLLLVYSVARQRRFGSWIMYLLIPLVILGAYELYTHNLYGRGHIWSAVQYATPVRELESRIGRTLVALAFAGGCTLPALTFAPFLWSRKQILWGGAASSAIGLSFFEGWVKLGSVYGFEKWMQQQMGVISIQFLFYIAGAISILGLAFADYWKRRNALSLLLLLWVVGTLFFTIVVNPFVNARSILPITPAVGILITRRLDEIRPTPGRWQWAALVIPLIVSGAFALWVAAGDAALAGTARTMANKIRKDTVNDVRGVRFEGHWGFQYYMELVGARPLEEGADDLIPGDLVVVPEYNTSIFKVPRKTIEGYVVNLEVSPSVTTMNPDAGAGFYFSGWGPLPFAIGPVPNQRYYIARVMQPSPQGVISNITPQEP